MKNKTKKHMKISDSVCKDLNSDLQEHHVNVMRLSIVEYRVTITIIYTALFTMQIVKAALRY